MCMKEQAKYIAEQSQSKEFRTLLSSIQKK